MVVLDEDPMDEFEDQPAAADEPGQDFGDSLFAQSREESADGRNVAHFSAHENPCLMPI
jgi:hypothetical protein